MSTPAQGVCGRQGESSGNKGAFQSAGKSRQQAIRVQRPAPVACPAFCMLGEAASKDVCTRDATLDEHLSLPTRYNDYVGVALDLPRQDAHRGTELGIRSRLQGCSGSSMGTAERQRFNEGPRWCHSPKRAPPGVSGTTSSTKNGAVCFLGSASVSWMPCPLRFGLGCLRCAALGCAAPPPAPV